jgi:hypothetical protein
MGYLDAFIYGVRDVYAAGVLLTRRGKLNFGSGMSAVDNPTTGAIDVTNTGGGTSPTFLTSMILRNPANTFSYTFTPSAIVASRIITLPLLTGNDQFVFEAFTQTLTNKTLTNPIVNGQTQGASVAIAALAINWASGNVFTKTLAAGANVFTFSNQASGMVIVVRVTGAASTLTWPTVKWAGGVAPTQTASGTDVYTFVHDGTNIYGSVVQAMA